MPRRQENSIRLDANGVNHFGPLPGFGGDVQAKPAGCERHRCCMRFGEPSFNDWVLQSCGNFAI